MQLRWCQCWQQRRRVAQLLVLWLRRWRERHAALRREELEEPLDPGARVREVILLHPAT